MRLEVEESAAEGEAHLRTKVDNKYVGDPLISRSQAKRVLARVDLFRTVVFDFSQVDSIGRAFADEIFRVFAQSHPEIELHFIHANASVRKMITRARSHRPGHG